MLSTVLRLGGKLWSDLPSSFGYTIGDRLTLPFEGVFSLFEGFSDYDRSAVSVFVYDKKTASRRKDLDFARTCLKRMKTIRHPHILRTLEGVEVGSGIYIVTEFATPLVLSTEIPSDPSWGLFEVTDALSFLNKDCGVVHGLICPYSVFVTEQGDWRLAGLEALEDVSSSTVCLNLLQHPYCTSAYTSRYNPSKILKSAAHSNAQQTRDINLSLDRATLASFFCWVFAALANKDRKPDDLVDLKIGAYKKFAPPLLTASVDEMLEGPAVGNPPVDLCNLLTTSPFFTESPSVRVIQFLRQVAIKGGYDKDKFFEDLPSAIPDLPTSLQKLQVLPEIQRQIELSSTPSTFLPSVLKIGESLEGEDYRKFIMPILLKFCQSNDRAVRYTLLNNIPLYNSHFDSPTAEKFFENVVFGFTDSCAPLREVSLKSMVVFVPLLRQPHLQRAFRLMARLQQDQEPLIRTNAVICFAKVAMSIPPAETNKILLPVFSSALKDKFAGCRIAGFQALLATSTLFSLNELTGKLLPLVCVKLTDPDTQVRVLAFATIEKILPFAKDKLCGDADNSLDSPSGDAGNREKAKTAKTDKKEEVDVKRENWASWAWKKTRTFANTGGQLVGSPKEVSGSIATQEAAQQENLLTESPPPLAAEDSSAPPPASASEPWEDENFWDKFNDNDNSINSFESQQLPSSERSADIYARQHQKRLTSQVADSDNTGSMPMPPRTTTFPSHFKANGAAPQKQRQRNLIDIPTTTTEAKLEKSGYDDNRSIQVATKMGEGGALYNGKSGDTVNMNTRDGNKKVIEKRSEIGEVKSKNLGGDLRLVIGGGCEFWEEFDVD